MTEAWLCFSGGNALGAFHVGAWQAIEATNLRVTRMSGASIGAVVAAVIAGNAPDRRDAALQEFLARIATTRSFLGRRGMVAGTMAYGHPALFLPSWPGLSEILPGMPADRSMFRRQPMQRLLERLVDFDRLNDGAIEVTVTALDAETGQVVDFRNTRAPLTVDHLMAATALPVLFRPVGIDGRLLLDAGLCENLPLRPLLDRPGKARIIALDLFSLQGAMAPTMDGIACRAQDLAFAGQSIRSIESRDLRDRDFRHVVLTDPDDGFAGKAFDFGKARLERRVQLGRHLTMESLRDCHAPAPA